MAVKPTPNNSLYKGFTFDGIDSRDYGVYISGDAVFDSPERDVEMIEIPGRNGSFALDKGRFGNITVSYPAGLFGEDEASFREGIRALRNALASRKGYCRLEDDYNPDEYRMAVYKKGLEVDPALLKAGEFTIEFDCMPQRWIKSGETAVSVASGGQITNPTLFESHPLLMTKGYGNITIGTDEIDINNDPYGRLLLANAKATGATGRGIALDAGNMALMDTGDAITVTEGTSWTWYIHPEPMQQGFQVTSISASIRTGGTLLGNINAYTQGGHYGVVDVTLDSVSFNKGTSGNLYADIDIEWTRQNGMRYTFYVRVRLYYASYDELVNVVANYGAITQPYVITLRNNAFYVSDIYGDSTKTPLDETVYIDTDIGEAYTEAGGVVSSANALVSLPAKLPTLKSGENAITYDDTITQFKVVPRWWEV